MNRLSPRLKRKSLISKLRAPHAKGTVKHADAPLAQPRLLLAGDKQVAPTLEVVDDMPSNVTKAREDYVLTYPSYINNVPPEFNKGIYGKIDCMQYPWQQDSIIRSIDNLFNGESTLIVGATGTGKAYVLSAICRASRELMPERFPEDSPIFVVTKNSIIIQTRRAIRRAGVSNIFVVSYDNLRSSIGSMYLNWRTEIINNTPILIPSWDMEAAPCMLLCDECQALKNLEQGSQQATIVHRYFIVPKRVGVFLSATPFSKPAHTRVVACALKPYINGSSTLRLKDLYFPSWIREMSAPNTPNDFSPPAMKRIIESFGKNVIRFKGIRYKHQCRIRQQIIPFMCREEADEYAAEFEKYQRAREEAKRKPRLEGIAAILVAILKFRQAAERIRAPHLARFVHDAVQKGYNAILGTCFQETLALVHTILKEIYGYKDDDISVIIGGQNAKVRQDNIDKFQREERHIMLLMFQAGGAGLSLHNDPTNSRPRRVYLPPVWSAEEMLQVLGRAHRINSVSTTYQYIIWYGGTIEERVSARCEQKIRSSKAVIGNDTWAAAYNEDEDDPQELADKLRELAMNEDEREDGVAADHELPIDIEGSEDEKS